MLDNNQVMPKLYDLSELFKTHMKNKNYGQAKDCYDTARDIAVKAKLEGELEEKQMEELFGKRGEIIEPGIFPEKEVQKAYYEVSVKRNSA